MTIAIMNIFQRRKILTNFKEVAAWHLIAA